MQGNLFTMFKAQLEALRIDALEQLQSQRGGAVGRAESAADALANAGSDQAAANTERSLTFTLEERESAELVAIDAAIQRLADGSFGLCIDCGTSIPTDRLHATPTALRCLHCQTALEMATGKS